MALDFDMLLNAPVHAEFGRPVRYRPAGGAPFDLADAIFDRADRTVTFDQGEPVSTTAPLLTVRLSAFPAGLQPQQGDTVDLDGECWEVTDVRADGVGGADLPLRLAEAAP